MCIRDRYAGMKLSKLWNEHPELFGKEKAEGVFPLLTKIIDAKADLSIQVPVSYTHLMVRVCLQVLPRYPMSYHISQ